jgi:hypothetical protein
MVEAYTVQNAMKSGKKSETYGEEYYVKFVESEQTFPLWFKKDPTGQKINGTINGSKFVKDKTPQADEKPKFSPTNRGRYDSDGQRQGMCINNAANYVNAQATELVDDLKWAQTVWKYANALYLMGDLGKTPEVAPAESTGELFGGTKDAS